MKPCTICENEESKYKCPICEIPYCSVSCFKKHKETPCEKQIETPEEKRERKPRTLAFTTMDTAPLEKLDLLKNSEKLNNLLRNPHLRDFLKELDNSPSPEQGIQGAMMEPLFLEFADECLKIVEPQEQKGEEQCNG